MIKTFYFQFINFFKNLAKNILKSFYNKEKESSFLFPVLIFTVNIAPLLFFPMFDGKAIISSDFSLLYIMVLMPLNGILLFFHSLMSKSNILCGFGLKSGIQSLMYLTSLIFIVISVSMNAHSFDLEIISNQPMSLYNVLFDAPIAFLYVTLLLLIDTSFTDYYHNQYSGINSLILKISSFMFPLKEIILFILLFIRNDEIIVNDGYDVSFLFFVLKVAVCYKLFKIIGQNIPKLRVDQIIDIFFNRLLFVYIVWVAIKSAIAFI